MLRAGSNLQGGMGVEQQSGKEYDGYLHSSVIRLPDTTSTICCRPASSARAAGTGWLVWVTPPHYILIIGS
jgi:hypothetical protein